MVILAQLYNLLRWYLSLSFNENLPIILHRQGVVGFFVLRCRFTSFYLYDKQIILDRVIKGLYKNDTIIYYTMLGKTPIPL